MVEGNRASERIRTMRIRWRTRGVLRGHNFAGPNQPGGGVGGVVKIAVGKAHLFRGWWKPGARHQHHNRWLRLAQCRSNRKYY